MWQETSCQGFCERCQRALERGSRERLTRENGMSGTKQNVNLQRSRSVKRSVWKKPDAKAPTQHALAAGPFRYWTFLGLEVDIPFPSLGDFAGEVAAVLALHGDILIAAKQGIEGVRAAGEEERHLFVSCARCA